MINARFFFVLLFYCCLLSACADLPGMMPVVPGQSEKPCTVCSKVFLHESREFVHSIEITLPGGHKSMMMGVTRIFPETGGLHCAIMTIEGLVIFEARDDGGLVIDRGIPPFDSIDFARGMMDDIRMIFYEPSGDPHAGVSGDGKFICRYKTNEKIVTDLTCHPGGWALNRYVDRRRVRSVEADMENGQVLSDGRGIPGHIRLEAFGHVRYTLDLTLVQTTLSPPKKSLP